MCPSKASSPPKGAAPLVDNSHNEEKGLSILSIHTESVMGMLSVVGVIIALVLMAVCIYRHYIKKMMRGTQAMVAVLEAHHQAVLLQSHTPTSRISPSEELFSSSLDDGGVGDETASETFVQGPT